MLTCSLLFLEKSDFMLRAFMFTCRWLRNALRVILTSPLLAPLRLTSLCQIACSEAGRAKHNPARLPSLLCCDFAVRSESNGGSCASLPAGLRLGAGPLASRHSPSLTNILRSVFRFFDRLCNVTWKGTMGKGKMQKAECKTEKSFFCSAFCILTFAFLLKRGQRGISDEMKSRLFPDLCVRSSKLGFNTNLSKVISLSLIFLSGCSSLEQSEEEKMRRRNAKGEYIVRRHDEQLFSIEEPKLKKRESYPWEESVKTSVKK
jgi:hypothetical protein